ncbi:hypothetical protein AB0L88_44110 [Saccharopolyspora shandongensis]|uniref:hypothetical protein n=1 Tax=Saccharopolyspora shandongensis TaxID=418495 RepID=UPI0034393281
MPDEVADYSPVAEGTAEEPRSRLTVVDAAGRVPLPAQITKTNAHWRWSSTDVRRCFVHDENQGIERKADTKPRRRYRTTGITERAGQRQQLLSGAGHEEIDDGVRLVVPAERTSQIATLAAAEQRCCPFFDFRLHLDGPVLRLEVRAPAEGAALLTELFTPAS